MITEILLLIYGLKVPELVSGSTSVNLDGAIQSDVLPGRTGEDLEKELILREEKVEQGSLVCKIRKP